MTQLVLGVAGAAIGSMVPGVGPALGWSIGVALGGVLDPQVTKVTGPKLSDLKVQASTIGTLIRIHYGSPRAAGNIIWSTEKIPTETTTSEDGKGGSSVETTSTSYAVSMAVSLGEGEGVGIKRIWAYGTLIYNVGSDATADTLQASQQFARGFKFYPGSQTQMPDPTMESHLGVGNVCAYRGQMYVVFDNLQLAQWGNNIPNFEFEVIKLGDISTYRRLAYETGVFPDLSGTGVSDNRGPFNLSIEDGTFLFSGGLKSYRTDLDGVLLASSSSVAPQGSYSYIGRLGNQDVRYIGTGGIAGISLGYLQIGQIKFIYKSAGTINEFCGACVSAGGARLYISRYTAPDYYLDVYDSSMNLLTSAVQSIITPSIGSLTSPWVPGDPGNFAVEGNGQYMWIVAGGAGNIAVYFIEADGSLSNRKIFSGAEGTGIVGNCALAADDGVCMMASNLGVVGCWTRIASVDDDASTTCGQIVLDQCERSGIPTANVDVSELTDQVQAFSITRQGSARANIEQLQKAYFFDAALIDNKVKFVKRGGAAAVTIPFEDLAAHEPGQDAPDAISLSRMQEMDLPRVVTVNYINKDADYQAGSESARRLVTQSLQEVTEELAIAMSPAKAAQISEVLLYDAHVGRISTPISTTRKYAKYSATDVFLVEGPATTFRMRAVSKMEDGPLIKWQMVADDATVYTSNVTGGSQQVAQVQVGAPGPTRTEFMDIPLIRDTDDDAGFYVTGGGYKPTWRGYTLYKSVDDNAFGAVGTAANSAIIGACDTTLGAWAGGNVFDNANSLTVTVANGELYSATRAQVLSGANAILVGSEILQYMNAELIAANQYRLSGFLRGRRGTEQHMGTHGANERFVFLSVAGTLRPNEGAVAIGALRYYKPVSVGQRLAQALSIPFTNTAVGLKPYAPARLRGGRQSNGDFIVNWNRRTRIDGGWRNAVDVGLGESSASYSVDIMNGSTVVRTIASSTETVTYTSAQQTTDFGSPRTTITVNVYQVSAAVGRGFAANKTY